MEKTKKDTLLVLIEFKFCNCILQLSSFKNVFLLPMFCFFLQSDVHGFVKASFMATNYQPACCSLENECDSGIHLHLNIWCPDNKICQYCTHNTIKKEIKDVKHE